MGCRHTDRTHGRPSGTFATLRRRARPVAVVTCLLFAFGPLPATARVLGGAVDAVLTQPPITAQPPIPDALEGLQYGNPGEGIGLMEPPTPDNTGEAQTTYPIDIPPGRLDWQPDLALTYGSRLPNGWLGVGWDLSVPSITVDTRWGVPRYDSRDETETYSFEGEQLSPTAHRGQKLPREDERRFSKRVEGSYALIVRHGTNPTNYWWEVHDKVGNKFFYGRTPEADRNVPEAILRDGRGNAYWWGLVEQHDISFNTVTYFHTKVDDAGVVGANAPTGSQMYIDRINYTGSTTGGLPTWGAYDVTFVRDRQLGEARRKDVTIDARAGALRVTADLLRRIDITYNGADNPGLVRRYELGYEPGPFEKTLLRTIGQTDTTGQVFATHTLEYWNDVQQNGAYAGFREERRWDVGDGGDNVNGELGGVEPTALGGGKTSSGDGRLYLGFNPVTPDKSFSIGAGLALNGSDSSTEILLIDVNGDSLPDKVWDEGLAVKWRPNLTRPGNEPSFGDARTLTGLTGLPAESSFGVSVGPEAYVLVGGVMYAHGWSFTTGTSYFSDVNGDGMVDFVDNGTVLFNYLDANKQPTFTTDSALTAVPIADDEHFDPSLLPNDSDLEARARESFPLVDTVRRWLAPWHGAVRISGPIAHAGADSPDGVRVALQKNGTELWSTTIAAGSTAPVTPTDVPIPVAKGDRIYFRVQSVDNGAADAVNWAPIITYQDEDGADQEPAVDANGHDGWKYVASNEFTLGGRTGIFTKMPLDGQVRVRGTVRKTRATTDDVRVIVEHNGVPLSPPLPTVPANFVGEVAIDRTFAVAGPRDDGNFDRVALRLGVDSPIDVTALSWTDTTPAGAPTGPRLFYVSATRDGQAVPTTDANGNPTMEIKPPYDIDVYPESTLSGPHAPWMFDDGDPNTTATRTVNVEGRFSVPGNVDPSLFTIVATLTAKTTDRLLGKATGAVVLPLPTTPPTLPLPVEVSFDIQVVEGQPYWFDFTTRGAEVGPVLATDVEVAGADVGHAVHWPRLLSGDEEMDAFPQPYRGWGYAGYNGDGSRAGQSMNEDAFVLRSDEFPENEDEAPTDFEENDPDFKNPLKGNGYPYVPNPETNRWQGPKSQAPTDDQNPAARPNIRGITYGAAGGFSPSRLGPDSVGNPAGPATTDRAPTMKGRASQDTFGANLSAGLAGIGAGVSWGYSSARNGFVDLNGDGYPDIVGSGSRVQYTNEVGGLHPTLGVIDGDDISTSREYAANLQGQGSAPAIKGKISIKSNGRTAARTSAGVNLGFGGGVGHGESNHTDGFNEALPWIDGDVESDLADLNGDFLPDRIRVTESGFHVRWNLGYSFSEEFVFPEADHFSVDQNDTYTVGATVGFNLGRFDFAGGVTIQNDEQHGDMTWIDLNGDFLPDRVEGLYSGEMRASREGVKVRFNTGAGLGPEVDFGDFQDGQVSRSESFGVGGGGDLTVGIGPLCWPVKLCYIIVNAGGHGERSVTAQRTSLIDVDGDFLPDSVSSSEHSSMTVSRNQTGRTNLLKSIKRPLGAEISLDYARSGSTVDQPFPLWVLENVRVFDGHAGDGHGGGGDDTAVTVYEYDEDSNVYDFRERETYGFAKISEHQLDGAGQRYRTFERSYLNGNYYERGLLVAETLLDAAGRKYTATVNSYELRDAATGAAAALGSPPSLEAAVFPALTKSEQQWFNPDGGPAPVKRGETLTDYDRRGNPIRMEDRGEPGAGDDLIAETAFTECDGHPDFPWTQVPGQLRLVNATGTPLRFRVGETPCDYAAIVAVDEHLTPGGDGARARTDVEYVDPGGQVSLVTGPANAAGEREAVTYRYDRVTGLLIEIVDTHGLSTKLTYDNRFGRVASIEEPTGARTRFTYDVRGRLSQVFSPLVPADTPMITFDYRSDADDPWVLASHFDAANPNNRIRTVRIVDGVGKEIQTKHDATEFVADAGARDVMVVSGSTYFDAFGRGVRQYYPITEGLGPPGGETDSAGTFNATDDGVEPAVATYDVMNRVTQLVQPGGRATTTTYGFEAGPFGGPMLSEDTEDPEERRTRTYRDVRQNVVGVERSGPGGVSALTRYAYDPLQQLLEIQGPASNVSKLTYDLLGRRTSNDGPNTGKVDFEYDLASNLVGKITPNLRRDRQKIEYDYRFTRLERIRYPDNPSNNVTYTYGGGAEGNQAGRVKTIVDGSRTQDRLYDAIGNVTETRDIMKVNNLNRSTTPAHTFTTRFVRDSWSRILNLTYPDGEVVTNAYDSGGLVRAVTGVKGPHSYRYVDRLEYDKFGFAKLLNYGNGTVRESTYDDKTLWLSKQLVHRGDKELQDLNYLYDQVGNPTERHDDIPVPPASEKGGPSRQTFTYDDLYRLTAATGTYSDGNGKRREFTQAFTYDPGGKLTRKAQTDTVFTSSGSGQPQAPTTYDMAYEYEADQPLAPSHIGSRAYTWDEDGNNTGWKEDRNGQRRTITWDEEDRAASIADQGNTTTYRYDHEGMLGIERGPHGEVEYVNEWYTALNGGVYWKDVFAGNLRVATKRVKDNGVHEDLQYFLTGDLQGSITLVTDGGGKLFEHLEYFAGGEIWVREHSEIYRQPHLYAGMYHDEARTLYRTQARWYEPREGLMLSPDPLLVRSPEAAVANSRLVADYTYAFDNPVSYVDPTGNEGVSVAFNIAATILGAELEGQDDIDDARLKKRFKPKQIKNINRANKVQKGFSDLAGFVNDLGSISFDVNDDGEREIKVFGFSKKRIQNIPKIKKQLKPSNIKSKFTKAKTKVKDVKTKVGPKVVKAFQKK